VLTDSACQIYLKQLQTNPLRTKMLTSGSLAAAQEVLASWIAHDKTKNGHYFSSRVPKMAVYGAFISAPLGHVLISILQKVFAGRTSLKAKILQILVSNLIVRISGHSATATPEPLANIGHCPGITNTKHRVPYLDGYHRRRKNLSPDQSHG